MQKLSLYVQRQHLRWFSPLPSPIPARWQSPRPLESWIHHCQIHGKQFTLPNRCLVKLIVLPLNGFIVYTFINMDPDYSVTYTYMVYFQACATFSKRAPQRVRMCKICHGFRASCKYWSRQWKTSAGYCVDWKCRELQITLHVGGLFSFIYSQICLA